MVLKNWSASIQRLLNRPRHARRSRQPVLDCGHSRGPQDIRPAIELLEDRSLLSGLPELVKDINSVGASSGPTQMIDVNGTLFFIATTPTTGSELWKSDGTVAGTVLVKDIRPGIESAFGISDYLTAVGGTVFFRAHDGINGKELWKSDGTEAGTVLVKAISVGNSVGSGDSGPSFLVNVGGTLFFSADDSNFNLGILNNGRELWKSDGTEAGTVLVKDIVPGGGSSSPLSLTNVGGTLFFVVSDGTGGCDQLWKSDGTAANTVLVKDFDADHTFAPDSLTDVGGTLFFTAFDGSGGTELWKSDGSTAGTVRVKDIRTGSDGSYPNQLTNVSGTLFFSASNGPDNRELWKSDGTEAGTVLVANIATGFSPSSHPSYLTNVAGTLFFAAFDENNGHRLWKSDGSEAGTVLVSDNTGSNPRYPEYLTNVGGTLFFRSRDGVNGNELWKSDGTAAGTVLVKDINPGLAGSNALLTGKMINVGGTLFFRATEGTNGVELWKSDGNAAGTVLVKNIHPGTYPSYPTALTNVGGTLFFSASDGIGNDGLRKSDGTEAGTVLVKDTNGGSTGPFLTSLTNVGGTLFFAADGIGGEELWKSDGTTGSTTLVRDINQQGYASSYPKYLTNVGGTLFFRANDGLNGNELWKSDGTTAVLVKDINAGSSGSAPRELTDVNGTLFFVADDGINGMALWKSDGTEAGTVLVKDIATGFLADSFSSYPRHLTNVGGVLFFSAGEITNGVELWKSDGTEAGTVLVKDISAGSGNSFPQALTNVGGTLFFSAGDGSNGIELWKSDGTTAGTVLVKDIRPEAQSSFPFHLTNVGGTLFFTADDGINGEELWKSDGTAAGTVLVKNIRAGSGGSFPINLSPLFTSVGGTLYFRATDGIHGVELWKTNGTGGGTRLVQDLFVGSDSSQLDHLTDVNGRLFFTAKDNTHGHELWSLTPTEDGPIPTVTLSVAPATLAEAAGTTTVTATLSEATNVDITVELGFSGSATNISDYTRSNTQIVIAAGNTTGTITLTAAQDTLDENNETIVVDILDVTNGNESDTQQVTATITDDDETPPTVTLDISSETLAEAAGTATITATLSAAFSSDVTINLGFDGSATNVTDYTRSSSQIVITAGNTTGSITLTAVQDTLVDEDETILVEILDVTNGTESGTQEVTATITDDDDDVTEITVAVSPSSVTEDGVPNLVYTFTRSGITTGTTTVSLSLSGTATLTTDFAQTGATTFTAASKTLVFTAGQTTKTITINPVADTTIEADETVILTVNPSASYSVGASNSATGTISNDDFPKITLAASPASVLENGTGNLVYTFTRPGPTTSPLTVNFTVGGTATFDTDYSVSGAASFSATTGSVTFDVGQATKTVTLDPTGDSMFEPNETILLRLSAGSGYTIGTLTPVTTTITNDDTEVSITVSPSSLAEDGTPNLVYTITRVGTTTALTVNFNVSGTAALTTDYAQTGAATFTASAGTLSFSSGQTSKTITINPTADALIESDETVILTLASAATYSIGSAHSATGTILNDDPRVSVAVTPVSVLENGTANATYTFTRTGSTASALTVNFDVGGTATLTTDYIATGATTFTESTGSVTFAAGQATKTIVIDPAGDSVVEPNETVVLTLSAGTDYVIGTPTAATTTITNDDSEISLAVSPNSVTEDGTPNLVYTFIRTGSTTGALTVNFSVGGTATLTTDYAQTGAATFTASTGTLSFSSGQTSKTITINPAADVLIEPDETVTLTLTPAAAYSVGTVNTVTGTMTNDDPRVTVAVSPASVAENGTANATYTFTRSGPTTNSLTVNFNVGGTATLNSDYTATGAASFSETSGTITFAAGQASKTVVIDPTGDTLVEPNETVVLTIAAGVDYVIGTPLAATATITNDDTDVSVTVSPSGVDENGTPNLVFTFTRTGVTTNSLTVNFTVGGTATFSSDYSQTGAAAFNATTGRVSFSAGQTTKTITINPTGDTIIESDETVVLTIVPGTTYSASVSNSALGTILNDDGLLLSLVEELP